MRRALAPFLLAASLTLALTSAPAAAFFGDDEARKQIKELRGEITALRERLDAMGKNQLDFANQVEAMRGEMARLTGQLEVLTHSLEATHKRQQDFYVDLDNRLRTLESAAVPAASEPAESVALPPDSQTEMRNYETALGLFRESKYKDAQTSLEKFIVQHPQSPQLPSAHYWLASSLYQQKGFLKSAEMFGKVATSWPNDTKAPEALLQQANALVAAKDVPGAIRVLESLVEKYPTSPAVETARARLKTLAPKKK